MKSHIQQYFLLQNFKRYVSIIILVFSLFLLPANLFGQSFTPGYLTVLVTGDGTSYSSGAAAPLSVVEYTTSGTLTGVSVLLPSVNPDPVTNSISATSEGLMELSAERDQLIIPGYKAVPGTANVASSSAATINRVLYAIPSSAIPSRVAVTGSLYDGNNIRSGTSFGTNYFAGGPVSGPSVMNTGTILSSLLNIRSIAIFNGQTYVSSNTPPNVGISKLGSGIPTSGSSTATLLTGSSSSSPYNFSISPDGNTMYVADDGAGILKFTLSGGVFVPAYTVNTEPVFGLTVDYSGAYPIIYATTATSPSVIIKVVDGGPMSWAMVVASAAYNTVFRGITFSPGCFATASISGPSSFCSGGSTNIVIQGNPYGVVTYNINGGSPVTATLSNNGLATIPTGTLTANATYNLVSITTPSCSSAPLSGSVTVTVNPYPTAITGVENICVGSGSHLFNSTAGGSWHSSNTAIANINAITGIVITHSVGLDTITYTPTTGCSVTTTLTIDPIPSSVTGIPVLCVGASTSLFNATAGGSWSSSAPAVATVGSGSGVVNGVSPGTTVITYATGPGCTATQTVTVNPAPPVITGDSVVCSGFTSNLSDATSGGTWSSSNTAIATIGSASGILTAGTSGIDTIIYILSAGCFSKTPVTVNSFSSPITGTFSLCSGATTTLSNASPGGSWSTGAPSVATIGTGTGLVSGLSSGTATITYTSATGCYTTRDVTVNPLPLIITGDSVICSGSAATLSNATSGGSWSGSTVSVATIASGSGLVTGISNGTDTVKYTLPSGCFSMEVITVNPLPAVITGSHTVCKGLNTTLHDASPGGNWISSSTGVALAGTGTGIITGLSAGNATISYTSGNGCFSTYTITVNPVPSIITGDSSICTGATATLSDSASGGTWSSSNSLIATIIPGTGLVTGVTNGTDTVTYTLPTGCLAKSTITINPLPASISGSHTVCKGAVTALVDGTPGGSWSSATPATDSVGALTGVVTGINAGNTTITYTSGAGCITSFTFTVVNTPSAISGDSTVCIGSVINLTDATTGGAWSSSTMSIASIGTGSGTVSGVSYGLARITYTSGNGCYSVLSVTVNSLPASVSGLLSVCAGAETSLFDGSPGGKWTSGNLPVAAIDSVSGLVTGVTSGNSVMSYMLPGTGCYVTSVVTVNAVPSVITGPSQVCTGTTGSLADSVAGGTWASSSPSVATVGSSSGVVTGISSGSLLVTYLLSSGCKTFSSITIQPQPDTISGTKTVCTGSATLLADITPAGSWSSSNPLIAAVGSASGNVSGIGSGFADISYTLTTGCFIIANVTVLPAPPVVSGDSTVCTGTTLALTDGAAGGVWSSGNPAIATIGSGTGTVTGISAGAVFVTYTHAGCYATKAVTVNSVAAAAAITGPSNVCLGDSILLSDTTTGGIWSSSNANAGISAAGRVTGVSAGIDTITYSVTNLCGTAHAIKPVTINAVPAPVPLSGPGSVCKGSAIVLTDSISGGTWSMKNATATVAGGVVAGVTTGTDTCTYTVTNSCGSAAVNKEISVITVPDAGTLVGPDSVCKGSSITLTDSVSGGIWASSSTLVSVFSGVVTGITPGVDTIIYFVTNSCGTKSAKKVIKVVISASPGIISGPSVLCAGATVLLTDSLSSGGSWSASNNVATVTGGHVTGVSGGVDTIKYSVANGCGNSSAVYAVTVNPLPDPGIIHGIDFVCLNYTDTLTDSVKYGVWSVANNNVTVSKGVLTGITSGTDTVFYAVTNACGTDSARLPVTINDVQVKPKIKRKYNVLSLDTAYQSYQWQELGHNITGATNSTYTMQTPGVYEVIVDGYYGCKGWDSMQVRNLMCDPGSIVIFPNPTTRFININWCGGANVRINRIDGSMYKTLYNVIQLDLGELVTGVYLLCFFDDQGNEIRTFRVTKLPD